MSTRLHRSEVNHQLGRVFRCHGLVVTQRDIEKHLGYPLAEAGITDLRGLIAALSAVVDAAPIVRPPTAVGTAGGGQPNASDLGSVETQKGNTE